MTTRYVDGANGNDSWDGLAPNFVSGTNGPKATWNGAEDSPVAAGDLVHVRSGTYRELLTIDVSGTAGNAIEYRGDYAGVIWPGGGVVRITGSDNDQTATRNNCITGTTKIYRTFRGFRLDTTAQRPIAALTDCTNWIIDGCFIKGVPAYQGIYVTGAGQAAITIQNCLLWGAANSTNILFTHSATVSNAGHLIQNCVFLGGLYGIQITAVGGITVKNCVFTTRINAGILVDIALAGGQTETVNNCIFDGCNTALSAANLGEITEDYNTFYGNNTNRTNVATGASSITYPPLFDSRWFFELVGGKGRMLSPFDLASYSQLVNLAGTSPSTTDMRGTAVIGAQREWGALEYDSTLRLGDLVVFLRSASTLLTM
ncbi:MAG: hypothetical protein A2V79_01130 [Betaproteobacteria bacterium RBG_16_56_24]|nr:MAG: hypothetical protein A2V79_01130 [Betaproteobacteria bacterium RBG_16_56_24]